MRNGVNCNNWLTYSHRWKINQLIVIILILLSPKNSLCFKYISLDSTNQRVNVTLPEVDQLNQINNTITFTDNTITDNDSEEGHAKVVKTISTLLAESLNKSIGHFQYIQDANHNNQDSSSSSESSESNGLRLSLIRSKSIGKKDCPRKKPQSNANLEVTLTSSSSKALLDSNQQEDEDEIKSSSSSPSSFNPINLVTQVSGLSTTKTTTKMMTNKNQHKESTNDEDEDESEDDGIHDKQEDNLNVNHNYNGDKINLRNYFKLQTKSSSPTEMVTDPSPVYQPEGYDRNDESLPFKTENKSKGDTGSEPIEGHNDHRMINLRGTSRKGKKVINDLSNNKTQFICIKVIDGKVTSPLLAKQIYPQLKESSLIMPTVPKIPLSYPSYKRYLTDNDTTTNEEKVVQADSNVNGTERMLVHDQRPSQGPPVTSRRGKTYSQQYYPVNLISLDSIKSSGSVNYTLTSTLSFDDHLNSSIDYVGNNQRRLGSTTNEIPATTSTQPSNVSLDSESGYNYGSRSGSGDKKVTFKPITYKTTVIIPKITTTTVSLSTNYPKIASESTANTVTTTTTPMPSTSVVTSSSSSLSLKDIPELFSSSNKIESKGKGSKASSKGKDFYSKEVKSSVYHKKGDKSSKKEIKLMNLGSSISPQRLISSRIRFPDSNQPSPLDSSSFDSFELAQPPEEPIIIPNSLIRPTFGLTSIGQTGQSVHHHHQQLAASNQNPFTHHQQRHHHHSLHHLNQHQQQQPQPPAIQPQIQYSPQQLAPPSNQYALGQEILPTSTLLPNDLTESPLIGLISPLSSSYKGIASKIKSAINFSTKQSPPQKQQSPPPQPSQQPQVTAQGHIYHHNHAQNPYTFNFNSYEQPSGYETIYGKLNSPQPADLLYAFDPRLGSNYNKPETNLIPPYLTSMQGSFIRQPASKLLRQYQALVTSASSIVQRNPSQSMVPVNHHQQQQQSNRQSSQTFYPVFQPVPSLSLTSNPFDVHQIAHLNPGYHHTNSLNHHLLNNQQLRPSGSVLSSLNLRLHPNHHLTSIESMPSSSSQSTVTRDTGGGGIVTHDDGEIIGISSSSSSSSSSDDDIDKQTTQSSPTSSSSSSRKSIKSKTGSSRSRNSKSKSKRKSRRSNLSSTPSSSSSSSSPSEDTLKSSSSLSSSESKITSSPKTVNNYINPCSSSTNCQQSTGGLLFNPSRSVKFELRDALP